MNRAYLCAAFSISFSLPYFSALPTFSKLSEYSAMMTIAAWVSNEAIPGALPVWHP
jgi:hypothetical protein